jgi:chromatin remodeling complex protein RSC6
MRSCKREVRVPQQLLTPETNEFQNKRERAEEEEKEEGQEQEEEEEKQDGRKRKQRRGRKERKKRKKSGTHLKSGDQKNHFLPLFIFLASRGRVDGLHSSQRMKRRGRSNRRKREGGRMREESMTKY